MTYQEVEKLIKENSHFQDFLTNHHGAMMFEIENVSIVIFKENIGTSFYYRLPYQQDADYTKVCDFMRFAIPILSKSLEQKRTQDLIAPGNPTKATIK